MSEVIEGYIRRHPDLPQAEAFAGFLQEERIRAWVGNDDARRERLQREFARVWESVHVTEPTVVPTARSGPSGPSPAPQGRTLRVEVTPVHEAPSSTGGGRQLQVLCTNCRRMTVWMDGGLIHCRSCGHAFDDMLHLIRVTPVGPFAFLFGEGWKGAALAGGIGVGLVAMYLLLRGF